MKNLSTLTTFNYVAAGVSVMWTSDDKRRKSNCKVDKDI